MATITHADGSTYQIGRGPDQDTSAQLAYVVNKARITKTLNQLNTALALHSVSAAFDPTNWGYAGDLRFPAAWIHVKF